LLVVVSAIAVFLSVAPVSASPYAFGERPLRQGMRGDDVRVLQDHLTRVGLPTEVDGHYGPITARRVRSWERHFQRHVNGRVSRPDATELQSQVDAGVTVAEPTTEQPEPTGEPRGSVILDPDGAGTALVRGHVPDTIRAVVAAANEIVGKPYRRGGGHQRWANEVDAVDCSGAVSWALHGGGLLDAPVTSGALMTWGERRKGEWITVYAHSGHVYMMVDNLRFDTGYHSGDGPRWTAKKRSSRGFTRRHPAGL
jgi:hypothetical protein